MTTPTFTMYNYSFFLYSDELSRHVISQPVHLKIFLFYILTYHANVGCMNSYRMGFEGGGVGCSKSFDISE